MARDPLVIDVDISALVRATERFAVDANRGFNDAFKQGVSGMVRRALAITPPASRNSALANAGGSIDGTRARLTKDDQARGKRAVETDLYNVFRTTDVAGGRKKKAESVSQMQEIHSRLFERKTPGRKLKTDLPNGEKYRAPADAFKLFLKMLQKRVGYTASGWNAGARKLGIIPPAWVGDKSAAGSATIQITGVNRRAIITNGDVPPKLDRELRRRVVKAQEYQTRAMARLASFLTNKASKNAGFNR